MKKVLQIICINILISNFSYSQSQDSEKNVIKYFDQNYSPLTQKEFENIRRTNKFLDIQGDSINHKVLLVREEQGTIQNKETFDLMLSSASNNKIDSSKPIVIIYYPGKDWCNSSGSATRRTVRKSFNKMEKGINKIKKSTIIYIYKDAVGLYGKNDGFKEWIQDPGNHIERLFFQHHYSCSSFVVISSRGDYISYFGEFSKVLVLKAVTTITSFK
ncbi:hypothetical protein [Flavobacterium sp. ACAM 123]|jgi:hypothetical protein|uniref:hypothetical protein n=1 Tax=Flavobacterium sp. ACAM 123 TaxID=1189620 RepID=UPI0002E068E5|nr:hypothetical protein [Flavobacterium sp. ACAM 123]